MNTKTTTFPAFSIIEVLIGIFVFSLGLVSIYALLASSLKVSDYSNNAIIASNLAREQIELFRNIRDTNYEKLKVWNQQEPQTENFADVFEIGHYYSLEYKFGAGNIEVNDLGVNIPEGKTQVSAMQGLYGLCIDGENRYTYDCVTNPSTPFMRYLYIQQAKDEGGVDIEDAYQVTSKVIWYKRGYHEYEISTIVTDWRRI